jgi:methionyl-tRNA formyltransferase
MRLVFFGTPEFAVPSLRALIEEGFEVAVVVTQPDRPVKRSRSAAIAPPVKRVALEEDIPVLQPERPIGAEFEAALRTYRPDLGIVVAYGHILKPDILTIPPRGMLNVHASLLPQLRGPAPVHWAILNGAETTGVSIMQLEAGLDTGPVLHRIETEVAADETGGELLERLGELGAAALIETLTLLEAGAARAEPQDDALATYAPKIDHESARLAWDRDAASLARAMRAFDPEPGAWSKLDDMEVKFFGGRAVNAGGPPGTVLEARNTLQIAAGVGAVEVSEVQAAGKKRMPVGAWLRGRGVTEGQRFA